MTGRIVILLENLPVERDRRVWRQARALAAAGLSVTVVCPGKQSDGSTQRRWNVRHVDGIEIRSFVAARERGGIAGFVWEYAVAWVQMVFILRLIHRRESVTGIQACNPPDIFFPIAWWARRRRIPFVFDQHDLCPELFATRVELAKPDRSTEPSWRRSGPSPVQRLVLWALRRCERATYRSSTRVIATNESYRRVAVERGGRVPADVVVVRNGPDPGRMRPRPERRVRPDGRKLVVWMGNIGPQDGVADAVRAVAHLVHRLGRTDTDFVFIGRGEARSDAVELATRLEVDRYVTFTGWIPDDEAFTLVASADVGLSADPPGPLNNHSTMNKTLEYMSFGLPVVAHDLHETRVSAGGAAVYAPEGSPESLAGCLHRLLADDRRMADLGREGRRRIEDGLGWPHQADTYVRLWRSLAADASPSRVDLHHPIPTRREVVA